MPQGQGSWMVGRQIAEPEMATNQEYTVLVYVYVPSNQYSNHKGGEVSQVQLTLANGKRYDDVLTG